MQFLDWPHPFLYIDDRRYAASGARPRVNWSPGKAQPMDRLLLAAPQNLSALPREASLTRVRACDLIPLREP
jgi:hypothetical protein